MIALLVLYVPGHAVADKGPTAIFMDLASVWFRALNTSGVYITSWKPNKDSPIGCTSCLTSGSSRGGTGTEILRAASGIFRDILGSVGGDVHSKIKVGKTSSTIPHAARSCVAIGSIRE